MAANITVAASMSGTDSTTNEEFSLIAAATVASMESKDRRQVIVPSAGVVTVLLFGAAVAAGQLVNTNGIMFINRDATNFITLGFIVSGAKAFYVKIPAGMPYFLWTKDLDTNVTGGAFAAFTSITSITAKADTADCSLEYIVVD